MSSGAGKRRMSAGAAAASASDAKAGRKEQPLMTLLKSFGTVVAPIMMSEIVNHASAEKCDNLLTAEEPDEDALHKGATLVLMVLFWFKYVPLNFLGVTPNPTGKATEEEIDAACDGGEAASADDTKSFPITADVALELKKTFTGLNEIYLASRDSLNFPEAFNRIRVPMLKLDRVLSSYDCAYDEAGSTTRSKKDNWAAGTKEYITWIKQPDQQQYFVVPKYVEGEDEARMFPILPDTMNAYLNQCLPPAPPPRGGNLSLANLSPARPTRFLTRVFLRISLRAHRYAWPAGAYGVARWPRHTR